MEDVEVPLRIVSDRSVKRTFEWLAPDTSVIPTALHARCLLPAADQEGSGGTAAERPDCSTYDARLASEEAMPTSCAV